MYDAPRFWVETDASMCTQPFFGPGDEATINSALQTVF